jgi:hypothetical protein
VSTYDLRADIKAVLSDSSLTDPGEIADKVAESIPTRALRSALRVTLRSYVRQVMAEGRTYSPPNFTASSSRSQVDTQALHAAGRSSKVRAIRDGWQRALDNRVHVGDSQWKLLGDCTYTDRYALAAEREKHAAKNQAWAHHYHSLAGLLTEYDVETVRDLPAQVLMPAIGAVA